MYYSDDIVEEVRSRSDIVDVISASVKLQKKGNSYVGLCPFHNEKTPSFSVSRQKQMYYCFGCGAGGNVFTFVMDYDHFTFPEAVKSLADRAGIALPEVEADEETRRKAGLQKQLMEIQKAAARYYYYLLSRPEGKQALDYLTGRGLTQETIIHFGLGYSPKFGNGLYQYLKQKDFSDDLIRQSGLVTYDEKRGPHDKFWNRAMFPIMDANNHVIGFGGRVMGEGEPKYLNSPETKIFDKSRTLYGLNYARISRKPYFIICEGYMDVISMHQAGFTNTIASLGTAFTSPHAALIRRYVDEVYLAYDSDGAGVKAALRAIPILKEAGLKVKVIHMTPYKDPDEFIKNLGKEAYEDRIRDAENSFLFEISVMERSHDFNDPQSKTEFYNDVAKKLLEFPQELERNNYIEAIARKYGIAFKDLKKLVDTFGAGIGYVPPKREDDTDRNRDRAAGRRQKEGSLLTSQKLLLTWMADDPGLISKIRRYISADDFEEPVYHRTAALLFEEYDAKGTVTPARIINQFEEKEEQTLVAALFNTNLMEEDNPSIKEKALNETIIKIKKHTLDNMSKEAKDLETLQKLVKEKAALKTLHITL